MTIQIEVVELRSDIKHVRDKVDESIELTNKILTTLHGNGTQGLVTRVGIIERAVECVQSVHRWVARTIGAALIVGLISTAIWWAFRK